MPPRPDRFFRRALACCLVAFPLLAHAFNLSGQRWTGTTIPMQLQLGSSGTLLDGNTSWDAAAESALAEWNANLTRIQFTVVRNSTASAASGNDLNNVFYSSTVYGEAFGPRVLAITLSRSNKTGGRTEGDVLFNNNLSWNSYRGPLRIAAAGGTLNDFRRVALHEFGHVLGLDHPDDVNQTVSAQMNSVVSNLDVLSADDIAGGHALYDSSTALNSALLELQGSAGFSSSGPSLTLRVDRLQNTGNATSGTVRLELWAMPSAYNNGLPTGSRSLGAFTFGSVLQPGFGFAPVSVTTTFTSPPDGSYVVAMLATEFTGGSGSGYTIRDFRQFTNPLVIGNAALPAITSGPVGQTVDAGASVTFTATASGAATLRYQWKRDGTDLPGATGPVLALTSVQPADAGAYTVTVTNGSGTATSAAAQLTINFARLVNLSVRTGAGAGAQTLIVGFALNSGTAKPILVRAIGPTLVPFGVTNAIADPVLTLVNGSTTLDANNDWGGGKTLADTFARTGAFDLPAASKDSALVRTLGGGTYSALISGNAGATGVALAELYDADSASPTTTAARLVNASARAQVDTGDNILIVGFNIAGNTPKTVLIRGVGPSLTGFGVTGALLDPKLELFGSNGSGGSLLVQSNDNWGGTTALGNAFKSVAAFDFASASSKDAAILVTLPPGGYSAQLSGVASTTGVGLVEIYEIP